MEAIAKSGTKSTTKEQLFKQWWDTQNKSPGLNLGPNCDTVDAQAGIASLNGFPYICPRDEGLAINDKPFGTGPDSFIPIAIVNRFDLASLPTEPLAADCGEYRLVFARKSGQSNGLARNLIIFEAVLPSPAPNGKDLSGCMPVAKFWADLSGVKDKAERTRRLKDFYFKGLKGFSPVIQAKNFGSATQKSKGQIRTNQFMEFNWLLREFQVVSSSDGMHIVPATVKSNPWGALFNETSNETKGQAFRTAFLDSVAFLEVNDINSFHLGPLPGIFDAGDSESMEENNDYKAHFSKSPQFSQSVKGRISSSTLTPEHIVKRAEALSCAGCHQLTNDDIGGNLLWPRSLTFVHVSEKTADLQNLSDGTSGFGISPALKGVFLPHRKKVLESFLASVPGK